VAAIASSITILSLLVCGLASNNSIVENAVVKTCFYRFKKQLRENVWERVRFWTPVYLSL